MATKIIYFASLFQLKLLRIAVAAILIFSQLVLAEASNNSYPKKINFRNILQNTDVPIGEVEAIMQDHRGFMWFGGRGALLRYDGYEFLNVPVVNNAGDPNQTSQVNQVVKLLEDRHQVIWAATRSGLYQYDAKAEVLIPKQGTMRFAGGVNAIAENAKGELLVGTREGLFILNTTSLESRQIKHQDDDPKSLPGNMVNDILVDHAGIVWIGQNEGLVRLDESTQELKLIVPNPENAQSTPDNGVKTIAEDQQHNIWIGTDKGIYRLNPATGVSKHYVNNPKDPYSIAGDITRTIFVDRQGWVWTGSDIGGISLYDEPNDRWLRFGYQQDRPGSLSSGSVRQIYEDNLGDVWVGTYPSGVNFYDRSTAAIRNYRREDGITTGLLDTNVESIEEDKNGDLWIGAGGVTRYHPDDESFTQYMHTEDKDSRISSTSLLNGVIDSDGEIRFGSWGHGILQYNPKTDRFDELPTDTVAVKRGEKSGPKLNDQMIWSVYEDKQKNLWISTHFNGLTKYDKKTGLYSFYPSIAEDETTISCPVVWTSFEDSHGRFWVGTAFGLNLMDREKGTFKRYMSGAKGLVNGSILSIWEDRKGRLWFATDMGLHLYHPETDSFTVYGTKQGFVDQGIRVILEDSIGNLWLGTNNGVVMFNPDTSQVRNYVRYNGQPIGAVFTGAGLVTHQAEIAFGTRTGLYIFDTAKLQTNKKIPPVMLTDFRIFTQKVPLNGPDKILTQTITDTSHITLDYTKSMIAFTFAALNFREPEKNQYAYKLEGFDDKWRYVANMRTALYTNLPAGTYQFHVKASNNDGVWNEDGRSIALTILPPPWKTWWAYCIYAAFLLGVLFSAFYRQHKKVLNERKTSRELEIKVAERTSQLQHKNAELEVAYTQLEAISLSDPLTGLNNRRYLQKLLPMDIAKVQREYGNKFSDRPQKKASLDLTFFILDVDHFKSVNDVYGHMAGDALLIQLSELLTHICRESDCVVRWGGEEFLIVSRFADRDEAPFMAERIRQAIEHHEFKLPDDTILKKTCSMGFACFPFLRDQPAALSWEQVIDVADHALYAAKKSGRNRSVGLAAAVNLSDKMLYQRISRDITVLINNQELVVIAEKNDDLNWT